MVSIAQYAQAPILENTRGCAGFSRKKLYSGHSSSVSEDAIVPSERDSERTLWWTK